MKKMFLLFFIVLGFSLTAHAQGLDPRLQEALDLRAQSTKASMQAEALAKRAADIELGIAKEDAGKGDKTRGAGVHQCVIDCINTSRGLYNCRQACGAY
jgi:hypothetical protein